jgi:dipeptidyl aminopeptidase/acylaminoacyl peptidase
VSPETIETPVGKIYDPFRESMVKWVLDARAMNPQEFSIVSHDGLKLYANFYEYAPGAPIELMFHGYRGHAERDLSGGVQRCQKLGRSAFIVDQRTSRSSEGNVITFGIREHLDCLQWVEFLISHFGPDVKIILTGISMGASTVLMAAGKELPENVIGVLADCGFNSAKSIMYEVLRKMGLPPVLCYPFVKLGAKLFGHFDLDSYSAEEAMKNCKVPVIFFHGEDDDFVPAWMSQANYDACTSKKELVLIPGAGHGLSYPVDPERYLESLRQFFGPDASFKS